MVRILRIGSFRIDRTVASVVVLPLPVGPVTTIMPWGSFSNRRSVASSADEKPSFSTTSSPRSLGRMRMTADSPCWVGMMATRISTSVRPARNRAAPSCGRRRSAMLRLATILMREITRLRQHAGGRRDRPQQAVDAHADHKPGRGKARYECRWRAVRPPFPADR